MKNLALSVSFFLVLASTGLQAQEREWALDATDKEAFLVFGVPDTDDVGLSFWCEIGSDKMSAFLPAVSTRLRQGEKTVMHIAVDGEDFILPSKADRDANSGKLTVEGQFTVRDKLVSSLEHGAELAIDVKGHKSTYPMVEANFTALLNACKGETAVN